MCFVVFIFEGPEEERENQVGALEANPFGLDINELLKFRYQSD